MKIWLLAENCIYIPIESWVIWGIKKKDLNNMPAQLLNLLIEAKNRKGSDLLSYDEIAKRLYPDVATNTGWDNSVHKEKFKKVLADLKKILPQDVEIECKRKRGYRLKKDIREYPDFIDSPEGKALFPSGDKLLFYQEYESNPSGDFPKIKDYGSPDCIYKNNYGDILHIVYFKPFGWRCLHNLMDGFIALNRHTINTLAYGLRTGVIKSIMLNSKEIEFSTLVSIGIEHHDVVSIIENALYMVYAYSSYGYGVDTIRTLHERFMIFVDTLNSNDEKFEYLSRWDIVAEWAESRLVNDHNLDGLIILLLLRSCSKGSIVYNLTYPELVLLESLSIRDDLIEFEKRHFYKFADDLEEATDEMIDSLYKFLASDDFYDNAADIIRSMDAEQRSIYKENRRKEIVSSQPLRFSYDKNFVSSQGYPTIDLESILTPRSDAILDPQENWIREDEYIKSNGFVTNDAKLSNSNPDYNYLKYEDSDDIDPDDPLEWFRKQLDEDDKWGDAE